MTKRFALALVFSAATVALPMGSAQAGPCDSAAKLATQVAATVTNVASVREVTPGPGVTDIAVTEVTSAVTRITGDVEATTATLVSTTSVTALLTEVTNAVTVPAEPAAVTSVTATATRIAQAVTQTVSLNTVPAVTSLCA